MLTIRAVLERRVNPLVEAISPSEDHRHVVANVVAHELIEQCQLVAFDVEFLLSSLALGDVALEADKVCEPPAAVVQRCDRHLIPELFAAFR